MIKVLKDCFDKKGNRYKVISFNGDKYQCQSYINNKNYYFSENEISDKPFIKKENTMDFFKLKMGEKAKPVENVVEPVYDFENIVENVKESAKEEKTEELVKEKDAEPDEPKTNEILKDNIKETADDFYADF